MLPPALAGCGKFLRCRATQRPADFADLAERVLPAVVNIAVSGEQVVNPAEFRAFERAISAAGGSACRAARAS